MSERPASAADSVAPAVIPPEPSPVGVLSPSPVHMMGTSPTATLLNASGPGSPRDTFSSGGGGGGEEGGIGVDQLKVLKPEFDKVRAAAGERGLHWVIRQRRARGARREQVNGGFTEQQFVQLFGRILSGSLTPDALTTLFLKIDANSDGTVR